MCLPVGGFFFFGGGGGGLLKESAYSFSSLPMARVGAWGTVCLCVYACMCGWVGVLKPKWP